MLEQIMKHEEYDHYNDDGDANDEGDNHKDNDHIGEVRLMMVMMMVIMSVEE